MKNLNSLILMFAVLVVFSFLPTKANAATTIFSDGFESNPDGFVNWTSGIPENGNWTIDNSGHTGKAARVKGDNNSIKTLYEIAPTTDKKDIVISYFYKIGSNLEGGNNSNTDHFYTEWFDGTAWHELLNLTGVAEGDWISATHNLPVEANNNANFQFRFRADLSSANDSVLIDDVALTGEQIVHPVCSVDTDCDDNNQSTTDTCVNPGQSNANCTHTTIDVCPNVYGVQTSGPCADEVCVNEQSGIWNMDNQTCDIPPKECSLNNVSNDIFSDLTTQVDGHDAVPVSPTHERWTASIPDATWIWSEDPILDPVNETTKIFTKTFNISGSPLGATLSIAADNGYSVSVNGHEVGSDMTEFNYRSNPADDGSSGQDSYTIPAEYLLNGSNIITFTVVNKAVEGGTSQTNPAGLLYKLTVNENDCQPVEPTTGTIKITKYICPADTSITRSVNGPSETDINASSYTVPSGCELEKDAKFGYTYDSSNQTNNTGPFSGLFGDTTPFTPFSLTDINGITTLNNAATAGRYIIVELDNQGKQMPANDMLSLYCYGDGDTSTTNDNQEITFSVAGKVSNCVAYNKKPVVPGPTDCATGFHLDNGQCVQDQISCQTGFHLVGSECVADQNNPDPTDLCPNVIGVQTVTPCDDKVCTDAGNIWNTGTQTCETKIVNQSQPSPSNNGGGGGGGSSGGRHRGQNFSISSSGSTGNGEVLGASTGPACDYYLKSYIKKGAKNDPEEVKKLQTFLNEFMGANLPITGFYGPMTIGWVNKFQSLHSLMVLKPWTDAGLPTNEPTGYVYKTTKRWINIIKCPELLSTTPMPSLNF